MNCVTVYSTDGGPIKHMSLMRFYLKFPKATVYRAPPSGEFYSVMIEKKSSTRNVNFQYVNGVVGVYCAETGEACLDDERLSRTKKRVDAAFQANSFPDGDGN